jgi:2-amino-4-hydroxy-6-hydroxymethyldihydropteridine diphosphokinase
MIQQASAIDYPILTGHYGLNLLPSIAYIGIGSNVGDRLDQCRQAVSYLSCAEITMTKVSSLYATEPVDYTDQDEFYNAVAAITTTYDPFSLLAHCIRIEQRLGKKIEIPKGPRTIDLDILFYQDRIICEPHLTVPHPSALKRTFVMIPMAEIAPDFIPPSGDQTIKTLCEGMPPGSGVRKVSGSKWMIAGLPI